MGSKIDCRGTVSKQGSKSKGSGKKAVGAKVKEQTNPTGKSRLMFEETLIPKPILSTGLGDEQKGIWE